MTKDYMTLAADILKHVGGKDNISFATHCVTRLRLTVKDKNRVEAEEINKLASVFGSKWSNNQFQVIIGNEVNDVYEALCQVGDFQRQEGIDENLDHSLSPEKKGIQDLLGTFMETLSSIFAPFIPAIVACGLLQGLLYSIQTLGWIIPIPRPIAFLYLFPSCLTPPIPAPFSAGKRFRCNLIWHPAAIIMHPTFSAMAGTSIGCLVFFRLPMPVMHRQSFRHSDRLFQSFVEKAASELCR
ncbi:MAG: PTS transporter subunit EIIB [Holdemania massiliensis]